jgi:Gluconate 2-dehydrogenase subunit 3
LAYDRKQAGHQVAQATRPDYRLEVGRAEVTVADVVGFSVLDHARAAVLRAWVGTLIPAAGVRPDAAEVGAAEYVDETVLRVPALRPALLQAIDRLEAMALARAHRSFAECGPEERELLLRGFEVADSTDAFSMVRDFTYEAYYGHPRVLAAVEAETGWHGAAPSTGSSMAPFDASRLRRVRSLPSRWRNAGDGPGARP